MAPSSDAQGQEAHQRPEKNGQSLVYETDQGVQGLKYGGLLHGVSRGYEIEGGLPGRPPSPQTAGYFFPAMILRIASRSAWVNRPFFTKKS